MRGEKGDAPAAIRAQALRRTFGDLVAVEGLDLEVPGGELFGLLGPNGAGKTTAISMMCGVRTPTSGSAAIHGKDIRRDPFEARRLLGLVPQELALYEDLSARQNLAFLARLYGLVGDDAAAAIDWALGVAGLADRDRESVTRYSGGMKRRLNLAAGILHKPQVLVLDEPTVGVDPQSRAHIFDTVRGLREEHAMTVLYTSHYMEEVQTLCSRVGIMDHGRLIALDGVDALIAAHAPRAVVLAVDGDAGQAARALEPLGNVTREDGSLLVEAADALGDVVRAVEGTGAKITALEIREADLETVFLSLTGRHLRDAS